MALRTTLSLLSLAAALVGQLPLAAQAGPRLPVRLGVSLGVASPSPDYQSACGHSHFVLRPDVRTRGEWFVSGAADLFSAGFGDDVGCLRGDDSQGGLDLTGAVGLSVGVGRRAAVGPLGLEAALRLGGVHGEPGYTDFAGDPGARWLSWAGGSVAVVVLDHLWLGYDRQWTRLPFRSRLDLESTHHWRSLGVLRIGMRL